MASKIKIKVGKKAFKEPEMEIVSDSESDEDTDVVESSDSESDSDVEETSDESTSESESSDSESASVDLKCTIGDDVDYGEDDSDSDDELADESVKLLTYDNTPKSFDDLDFNSEVSEILKAYSKFSKVVPHLIINGSEGSGKLTRIRCMLREIYGDGVFKLANRIHDMKIKNGSSTKTVSYGYMEGSYHFEIEPHLYSSNDKHVIQDFIKRLSDYDSLITGGVTFIVVKGLDRLSFLAQQGLRRLMELKMFNIRMIFTCETLNKVTAAIMSRCYVVLNPSVSIRNGCKVLRKMLKAWPECPDSKSSDSKVVSKKIAHICAISGDGLSGFTNLSKAIRKLQLSYCSGKYVAQKVSFDTEIEILYKIVVKGKKLGLDEVQKIRELLYRLYIELVDFRRFLIMFSNKCKNDKAVFGKGSNIKYHQLLHLMADVDDKLNMAVKPTLPLENFFYRLFWLINYE